MSQTFGGTSLPAADILSMQMPEKQLQEQVLTTAAEQLAVQPMETVVESPKVQAVEKATDDALYNSLFKSIESAGKAVGHAVENVEHSVEQMEQNAAKVLSQVPITAEVATKEITSASTEVSPLKSVVVPDKGTDSIAKRMEEAGRAGSESFQPKIPDSGAVALATAVQAAAVVKAATATAPPVKPAETVAAVAAVEAPGTLVTSATVTPPVKPTVVASSTTVAVTPPVKPNEVASTTSVAVPPPVKPTVVASASSVAAPPPVKPTVVASVSSVAAPPPVKPTVVASATSVAVPPPIKPSVISSSAVKATSSIAPISSAVVKNTAEANTPISKQISSGTYMKEAAPVMSAFQSAKLQIPKANFPDLKLPSMKLPDFSIPDVKLPSVDLPTLTMPKVNIPSLDDVPIAAKAAGAFTVGAAAVAVGVSLTSSKETVGSVMPPGTKKKGTTYLEGLTRSSTSTASTSSASSPYLESLNLSAKSASEGSSPRSSYIDNLTSKPQSTPDSSTVKSFRFAPQAFDPGAVARMEPPNTTIRPPTTAVSQEGTPPQSSTVKTFNFAPNVSQRAATPKENTQPKAPSVNEAKVSNVPEGTKNKASNQLFNFAPQSFDPNQPYSAEKGNMGRYGGSSSSISSSGSLERDNVDWRTEENGGYVWRDPETPQRSGPGVSYLDNLNNRPTSGAYNAYLDAMKMQPNENPVASLEKTWSNSPSENPPSQQNPNTSLPGNVKSFRKINPNGSYVDSL